MSTYNFTAEQKVKVEGNKQVALIKREAEKAKNSIFEQKIFVEKCLDQEKEKVSNWVINQIAKVQEEEIKLRGQKEELRVEIHYFRSLVADIKKIEPDVRKLFGDLEKVNDEMIAKLKRSHEVMQGPGNCGQVQGETSLPAAKKATVMVTPTATAKYAVEPAHNPYAKSAAVVNSGIEPHKNEFDDDELDQELANVDLTKFAAAQALADVGKAAGQSIAAEAAEVENMDENENEKGNLKNDSDYAESK
eukprot:scaffold91210_cov36-Cyclotella_meneghiniana.AAC.2